MDSKNQEMTYQLMVERIADAIDRYQKVDADLIHKIGALLEEGRPNKSKRFAMIRFLESCGLK